MLKLEALNDRYSQCRKRLVARNQEHLLSFWDSLDSDSRENLLTEIESIPWDLVDELIPTHVLKEPPRHVPSDIVPAPAYPRIPSAELKPLYAEARTLGSKLISTGKVAAFTVAGGQGTRLGFDGPKGAVAVTPVRRKTLFQLFAEIIRAASDRHSAPIPWYIMTSPGNYQQTKDFFEAHQYFGLPAGNVFLFCQGMLPSFDFRGKILMTDRDGLALAPDGHGGSLKSLVTSGSLKQMQQRGIEVITYFQVDNPLIKPFDELFIGLHRITKSEMSSKVTPKADDLERLGNVCIADGRLAVIEYSDFPEQLAHAKNPDGSRRFNLGSLAIHLVDVSFVERIVGHKFELPYHRAAKAVNWLDEQGIQRTPPKDGPNAVKLETFVFDALPLAKNPLVLEIDRGEEFSPVKNAHGVDSLETSIRDQVRRAARWLESAGAKVPRKNDGEPAVALEIAPTYAMSAEDLQRKLTHPPKLSAGENVYIS
jgi:UDP-N-acetylglucosamine/UDP-N-acetylgalactosamine diphosphorylase